MSHLDGLDIGSRATVLSAALRIGVLSGTTIQDAADVLIQLRDELDAANAERDRLRAHIDAAGDGANLVGLLDQYHEEAERMRGERDAARAELASWAKVRTWLATHHKNLARIAHDGHVYWAEMNDDTIVRSITNSVGELARRLLDG